MFDSPTQRADHLFELLFTVREDECEDDEVRVESSRDIVAERGFPCRRG
jgi:hypothetical protein